MKPTVSAIHFADTSNYGAQIGENQGTITNYFGAASPPSRPPPPPSAIIPFRRDRDFVERDVLNDLWQRASEPAARIGLVGLGGVGKTQLAIEYAYRVRNEYPDRWVFWVHANSAARFEESYKMIAERVQLAGWNEPKTDILGIVHTWLSNEDNGRWVMVMDNADSPDVMFEPRDGAGRTPGQPATALSSTSHSLSDYLPSSANGSLVITSRSREVPTGLIEYEEDILDVSPMAEAEAVTLLKRKLKRQDVSTISHGDLRRLVRRLDYIPLAITQAAGYINQRARRMTVSKYLEILEGGDQEQSKLLLMDIRDPRRDGQASNSVIATWHISFDHLWHSRHSAARLLSLMSLFDREGIPDYLLQDQYLDDQSEEADFEEDIATLTAYSLIGVGSTSDVFEMHRLVQFSTKTWLEVRNELTPWQERYVNILGAVFPTGDFANWPTCQVLFPHVEATNGYQLTSKEHLLMWATIQHRGAWYELEVGRYGVAEKMVRSSFMAREAILGFSDARTLESLDYTAKVLRYQGKYKEAEAMHRRALAGREKELGVDHPDTLTSVDNLALVLQYRGKYEEAEEMNRRALVRREKELGLDHPDTLTSVSNLALVLQYRGKYEEAEEMNRRALTGRDKELGENHPDTLTSVSNVALMLQDRGKYEEAEEMNRRALAGYEKELGVNHPDTLTSVSNLASVLQYRGKYEEAEEMNRRVLTVCEKELGVNHPDTLTSVANLASVLADRGKYEEAEEMNRRALAGYEKELGEDHPDTLMSVYYLAYLLNTKGDFQQALDLYRRAVSGYDRVLGAHHPTTAACREYLSSLLKRME
ncbi:hypothetical protein RBB50_012682 [Rhinocladiella similis]